MMITHVLVSYIDLCYELTCLTTFVDIDECDEGLHNCEQICINSIGSYTCQCYSGCELNSNNHSCTGKLP